MSRLSVIFPRKSSGKTIHRALASLEGAASEALPMLSEAGFAGYSTSSMELERSCESINISMPRHAIGFDGMLDAAVTYGGFLPEKNAKGATLCSGGALISSDLSHVANELLHAASGDYVLIMGSGEVCLDPLNIVRTLDFLDEQKHLDAVVCPVKIYDDGEHVKTVMAPKIFRRTGGKACFAGVLADDFEPKNDGNWLLSASGLTFMDMGDAWPWNAEADLLDVKLLLNEHVTSAWSDVEKDKAKYLERGTKIGQLLMRWNAGGALSILEGVVRRAQGPALVPALIARARGLWRYEISEYDDARRDLDHANNVMPTAAAYLERGFLGHGLDEDWKENLEHGFVLAKKTPFGIDLRELELAKLVLNARPPHDPKRCQEICSEQCLLDADGHSKHTTMSDGERVVWSEP